MRLNLQIRDKYQHKIALSQIAAFRFALSHLQMPHELLSPKQIAEKEKYEKLISDITFQVNLYRGYKILLALQRVWREVIYMFKYGVKR